MNLFVKALQEYYASQISEAAAVLNVYLNNSVGVGEHPDLMTEIKKYVDILDSADSKLNTINKYMSAPVPSQPTVNDKDQQQS